MSNLKRFGKLAPKIDYRTLLFENYSANLPAPPVTLSNTSRVYKVFGESDASKVFPMDGNDQYGNCTMAEAAHLRTTWGAFINEQIVTAEKEVVAEYLKLSNGQDNGLVVLDVLNAWHKNGFFGEKILAFVKVDPKNHTHVKQAMEYFGGIYGGFQVQANCVKDFDAGKEWTPGKLTQDGHAVPALDYDADSVTVLTWGAEQKGTWAWVDRCVDEMYAILPAEAKKQGYAPGFDFAQLEKDLADLKN